MMKNPFPAQGISEYPLKTPFIGQEKIYRSLKTFKDECFAEDTEHFFILRGDWGEGKSRIGHEVVAQCLDESKGWYFKEQTNTQERIFLKEDKILPLFIPFREVWGSKYEPIEKDVMPILIIRAFEFIINQNISIVQRIRSYMQSIDENLYEKLKMLVTQISQNLEEKANQLVSFTLEKFGFKKIFIIFDEIETPGDIGFTIEEQIRSSELPYEIAEIEMLARNVKHTVNQDIATFKNVNFFFLCSFDAFNPFVNIAALERRVKTQFISKNNYDEYLSYLQILNNSYEGISEAFNKRLVASIYIITDGNFGWFNFLSSSIFFQLLDTPDIGIPELLKVVLPPNELLFDNAIIETILTQGDLPDIPNFDLLLYDYIPKRKSTLKNPEDLLNFDTGYEKIFTKFFKIKTTSGDLLKKLKNEKKFEVDRISIGKTAKLKLTTHEHKGLPQNFLESLIIFPDIDNNDEFYIYSDFEQFKNTFNYCLQEDYPIDVIKPIYDTLISLSLKQEYIGLKFDFLLLISIRMKIKSKKKIWLYRKKWDEIIKSSENLDSRKKREKMIIGFLNLLIFIDKGPKNLYNNAGDDIIELDKYAYYYYVKSLNKNSILNTTSNKSLLILYLKSSNYVEIYNLLERHVGKKGLCPIIVIFNSEKEMSDANKELLRYPELEPCFISFVIKIGSIEYDFLVKFGYFNNTELIDDPIQFIKEDIINYSLIKNNSDNFKQKIENWKIKLENRGILLKPIKLTLNRLNANKKINFLTDDLIKIFKFIKNHESSFFKDIITTLWTTPQLRKESLKNITVEIEEDYFKQIDFISPIILPAENGDFSDTYTTFKLNFPQVFFKILKILEQDNASISDIAQKLFFIPINYSGADEILSGTPLQDVLSFLEHFFIINKDLNNKYKMINRAYIDKISKDARTKIDILLNRNSTESIKKFENIVGPTILIKLKINEANLIDIQNKIEALIETETDKLLENFFSKDNDEVIEVLFRLKEIPLQLKLYIEETKSQDDFSTDPEDLIESLRLFSDNEISEDYTLPDRINFIKKLIEYYDEIYKDVKSKLDNSETEIKSKYSKINGKDFPLEPTILSKIKELRQDLDFEIQENPKIRGSLEIKTSLKILRDNGDIISMITIFENYLSMINNIEEELDELFNNLENSFFNIWDDLSRRKKSLEYYLQDASSFKTELDDINIEFNKLFPYYSDFGAQPDVKMIQFEDLTELKDNIIKNFNELSDKIDSNKKSAEDDIQAKIDETEISYLNELEERLDKALYEPKEIWDFETYLNQVQAVRNLPNTINERAINYLNSDHFWDSFKEIIGKLRDGVNHEEIHQQHSQDFEAFNEANLNMFEIEIEIKIS